MLISPNDGEEVLNGQCYGDRGHNYYGQVEPEKLYPRTMAKLVASVPLVVQIDPNHASLLKIKLLRDVPHVAVSLGQGLIRYDLFDFVLYFPSPSVLYEVLFKDK